MAEIAQIFATGQEFDNDYAVLDVDGLKLSAQACDALRDGALRLRLTAPYEEVDRSGGSVIAHRLGAAEA